MKRLISGMFFALAATACVSLAAPEPAIVQGPGDWTVSVQFEHPQQMVLQRSVLEKPRRFWYTIVSLVNKTNDDVDFFPKCELMTDTFQIVPAGKSVPPAVFDLIKTRHLSKYPFLEPMEKADDRILQGDDNALDLAVIWQDFDTRAKAIKIFITGLSNETVAIDHPVAKDDAGLPVKVYLRKTLELDYKLRGDPVLRPDVGVVFEGKRWVMR